MMKPWAYITSYAGTYRLAVYPNGQRKLQVRRGGQYMPDHFIERARQAIRARGGLIELPRTQTAGPTSIAEPPAQQ